MLVHDRTMGCRRECVHSHSMVSIFSHLGDRCRPRIQGEMVVVGQLELFVLAMLTSNATTGKLIAKTAKKKKQVSYVLA